MKKIIFFVVLIWLLAGCNNNTHLKTENSTGFDVSGWNISMGGNEDFSEQYLTYHVFVSYKEGKEIKAESIEPLLANWVQERKLKHEITDVVESEGDVVEIEGKVTYNSKDLTKKEIASLDENDKAFKGLLFEDQDEIKYRVDRTVDGIKVKEIKE